MIERRTLITGLVALVAAPAIVKAAGLMKVAPTERLRSWDSAYWEYNPLLDKWTQYSAVAINQQYQADRVFYEGEAWDKAWLGQVDQQDAMMGKVGDVVRIRLPNDYLVSDGPALRVHDTVDAMAYSLLRYNKERRSIDCVPEIPIALGVAALAVAAAPVVEQVLQRPVTRRFWK